jgi:hypothetical protein
LKRAVIALILFVVGCGGSGSPTAPSSGGSPTPTPTPTPTTVSLTGTVSAQSGGRISGATIRILDGVNANRTTTTNANGDYRFDGLTVGTGNLTANATGYEEGRGGTTMNGTNSLNFTLRSLTLWTQSGTGNNVFAIPSYVTRVRITGQFSGFSSNFVVWCGTQLIVNELLGTGWGPTTYAGTHQISSPGCSARVENSTQVSWTFTEVR